MNPLDQMLSRTGGMSIFAGATDMSEEQRIEAFGRAIGAEPEAEPDPEPEVEEEEQPAEEPDVPIVEQPTGDGSRAAGTALPEVNLDAAEDELADSIGKEAAKTLMKTLRPLSQQAAVAKAEADKARVERLVAKFGGIYPELKKSQAALSAVVQVAVAGMKPGESDEVAFKRGLVGVYGDRKGEMKAQVSQQMTSPTRRSQSGGGRMSEDDINIAALHEYQKTGSVQAAQALKARLSGGR